MADYTDLSEANGWIPEPVATDPIYRDSLVSAVEAAGRKERMTSRTLSVPRFVANGVTVVPERGVIPLGEGTPDEVVLTAIKFADRYAVSYEDRQDAVVDVLNAHKAEWVSNFAVKFDNAALGVTVEGDGSDTAPYDSVYFTVGSGNRSATAGSLTYEDLVGAVGEMETSRKGGLVIIAHPAFAMQLRNLKDDAGDRVVATEGILGAGVPNVFGHQLYFSHGARTSAAATDEPAGNPLLIVAAKKELIVGVRSGPESAVSEHEQWTTDEIELKMRARRGFVLASADSARVVELTAGA